jgi:lipopolysaccharide export system permease protein
MNNVLNKYLIYGFLKIVFNSILIFSCLGILLNLFEEIEFFKELNQTLALPFLLSLNFVPTFIIELMPFIIFLSAMWYLTTLRSNTDLLSVKVFGYSNLKIILILALTAFMLGIFVLIAINPLTSTMIKFYEDKKAQFSRDTDHLISINKNGVWMKDYQDNKSKIITAVSLNNNFLNDVTIYEIEDNKITKRIETKKANIKANPWILIDAKVYNFNNDSNEFTIEKDYEFFTVNTLDKINSLYRNLNTISFLKLITEYKKLSEKGYSKNLLNEKINRFASLPLLLFLMVILASIFSISSLKKTQNIYLILISIIACVVIYYFKDLSIALGQTERIPLTLSVWIPVIAVGLFCSIGIIQINEK